ncbi:MAG: GTP cyclohydrolase FolE2 [Candidatus Cloacimonetes bacterium]|nr:GTP cyclohydrolase FolE2 [Candidatus Cloacimonadota bacterium]
MPNKDVQSERDTRKITIDRVGVKNIRYPIVVEDRQNVQQQTVADIALYVDLPEDERGTHMSRFLEVLNEYHKEDIIANLEQFMIDLRQRLGSDTAFAVIDFPYFIEKQAPVSLSRSLLSYQCHFQASLSEVFRLVIGVKVPITTLCPCSKEISENGAHSQRSYVNIQVTLKDFVWLEELIELVEASASCEIYSLLKRSDEKFVTEKAYDNPRFAEDIVREITLKLRQDERITSFRVETENLESIHDHNAYAGVWSENFWEIKD